jgi:hypothetical protein
MRRAPKLVRRAGARRSLERERGEWLRIPPRRWNETGAGSIVSSAKASSYSAFRCTFGGGDGRLAVARVLEDRTARAYMPEGEEQTR